MAEHTKLKFFGCIIGHNTYKMGANGTTGCTHKKPKKVFS